MRFTKEFLASLAERVPLSSLVGRVVAWDRRKSQPGRGDYWGCCPFHDEKSASFHVDDRRGFYHCFGCHASGDHLKFLTEHDGLDFVEAVKKLAAEAGVALPDEGRPEPQEFRLRRIERSALDAAAALYAGTLWSPAGAAARDYAARRGLTEETLRVFGFGLAPSAQGAVSRALGAEGISEADLERCGLAVRRDGRLRDRFVGRLMIPIHDGRGKIVGFGGRSLDGREPKYLNSPETPLFDKSALLFNAARARGPAHRARRLFVVEGYLDAIALAQAGIGEVVATCGTALTAAQIELAWTLADEPTLCFDGDPAGRAAAHRAIDRILPLVNGGRSFSLLALPDGQDPDDLVRSGGSTAFEALASTAIPLVDALFEREIAKGTETPERLAALEARLDALAGTIAEAGVARLYRSALRERAYQHRRARPSPVPPGSRRTGAKPASSPQATPIAAPASPDRALLDLERLALGLLILRPHFIERFGELLGHGTFTAVAHAGFAAILIEAYAARLPATSAELVAALPERGRMCLSEVWGDAPDEPVGSRLRERFAILECDPDDDFLARCMTLFVDRLNLRAQMAELAGEPRRFAERANGDDARLLSLTAAVHEHVSFLQDAERLLADEAAALRRRRTADGNQTPVSRLR